MRIKNRYLNFEPDHHFGSGEKMTLNDFIQRHQKMDKREVKAEGVDSDGNPVEFSYTLHENPIEGQETDGDVTACFELSLKFVRAVDKELEWRMKDLEELEGCKLFRSASYVPDDAKRVGNFKKWLAQLHKLYRKKLPGMLVDLMVWDSYIIATAIHLRYDGSSTAMLHHIAHQLASDWRTLIPAWTSCPEDNRSYAAAAESASTVSPAEVVACPAV
ncbi:unnamed protein product [Closterium sp. NIES-64]|nr:unnamed protein product [Closterium sp. NIES-64]